MKHESQADVSSNILPMYSVEQFLSLWQQAYHVKMSPDILSAGEQWLQSAL